MTPSSAIFLTVLATFFWGSSFEPIRIALSSLTPWSAALERFSIALVAIFVVLAVREGMRLDVLRRNLLAFIGLGMLGMAGLNGAVFEAMRTSSPITAALIMATTPLSANLVEAALTRQLPAPARLAGMGLSLLGVAMVVTDGALLMGNFPAIARGDAIMLAGSLAWAAYTVGTRRLVRDATPLATTAWTILFGTMAVAIFAFWREAPLAGLTQATPAAHLAMLYIGLAGTILAYLFWNMGVAARGAGATAVFFNFVPIFALLVSTVLGRAPSFVQIAGIALTILGVLVAQGAFVRGRLGILSEKG